MFDQGVGRFKGGKFFSRVCDDLAGAAATLTMLDEFHRKSSKPNATVAVLLTRAEEDGFIGAVAGSPLMNDALHQACRNILDGVETSIMDISGPFMFSRLVHEYMKSPTASFVVLPTNAVFGGVMQRVHNEAEYKAHGHWRHADI